MKKFRKSICMAIVACFLCGAAGVTVSACAPNDDPYVEEKVSSLKLNKTYLTMDLAETVTLFADLENLSGDVVWTTSNAEVVTVVGGVVEAVGEGSAEITAACGEYSDVCVVQVSSNGQLPVLMLNGDNAPVKLMKDTDFVIDAALYYKGEAVEDVVYTYKSQDEDVAKVDANGRLTYCKTGSTEIQVKAVWKNFVVYEVFTVEYVSVDYMDVSNRNIELYTSDIFGDKTTETLTFTVVADGVPVQNPTVTYEYDDEAISIVENVVSVLKKESNIYTVKATYVGATGTLSVDFTVTTNYPVKNMETAFNSFELESMVENDLSAFNCFADGSQVVAVYDTEEPTVNCVQGGKIKLNERFYGKRSWVVHSSEGYGYQVTGNVVTKIIRTAEEFQSIFMTKSWTPSDGWTTDTKESFYTGHFVLGNNIEFKSPTYNDGKYAAYDVSSGAGIPENAGFNGVFDGRGYTVSNIYLYSTMDNGNKTNGIFGTIGLNGVVKNVSFVMGGGCNWVSCYLANAIAGTVDNVFVQVDLATYNTFFSTNMGVLAYRILPTASVTNCVTYLSGSPYSHAADYSSGVHSFANTVNDGCVLRNNYTVVDGYALAEDVSRYDDAELKYYTADTLDEIVLVKDGFNAEYWDLTDGLLPIMKSSLELTQTKLSVMTNFVPSGANVDISLNCFEHRIFDVVASAGVISDGGDGEGQLDKKYVLNLKDVAGVTVSVDLKILGRMVDTVELEVSAVQEEEINLNRTMNYTLKNWDNTAKQWVDNANDLTVSNLSQLSGKTLSYAYVLNSLGETQRVDGATLNGTSLTLPKSAMQALSGDLTLCIVADSSKYLMDISVVTAELSTEEQFASIFLSKTWVGSAWKCDPGHPEYDIFLQEMTYNGYYVLTNNIEFSDTFYYGSHTAWNNSGGSPIPTGVGFNGILDGRGYTVSNLGVDVYINSQNCVRGIFGTIGERGVIRNIAFVNGRMAGTTAASVASYLANGIAGTLENVFVHIDLSKSTIDSQGEINVFSYGANSTAKFINCVAYVTGTQTSGGCKTVRMGNNWLGFTASQVTNCYVVAVDGVTVNGLRSFTQYSVAQVKNGASFTTANYGDVWDLTTYKLPVFTTAKPYLNLESFQKA